MIGEMETRLLLSLAYSKTPENGATGMCPDARRLLAINGVGWTDPAHASTAGSLAPWRPVGSYSRNPMIEAPKRALLEPKDHEGDLLDPERFSWFHTSTAYSASACSLRENRSPFMRYSPRSVSIGSTEAARRAGMYVAAIAATSSTVAVAP